MDRLEPLLRHQPGEVVINFMYDFVNRFLSSQDTATEASLDRFFGTHVWRDLRDHADREAAMISLYAEQVRANGKFRYVTSKNSQAPTRARVLSPRLRNEKPQGHRRVP